MKYETESIKLGYSMSPRNYHELIMRGDKNKLAEHFRKTLCAYLNHRLDTRKISNSAKFYIAPDNVVYLLNDSSLVTVLGITELGQNYVKVCSLPLTFFDDLADVAEVDIDSRSYYAIEVRMHIDCYLSECASHLLFSIPLHISTLAGAINLDIEVLTYAEFKDTRFYKRKPLSHAFRQFFKVVQMYFNRDFYLEISATQGENVLLLWDCRDSNVGVCYELLRYTEQDFDFLEDKDARVQKSFVKSYAIHIIMNNLKQILKGVKNG